MSDYYVYVYIDPRNFEEFYYGKGTGSRKKVHLIDQSDTDKAKRIAAIKHEGLEPIIRVIACGLSEHDALLVEKTLLWKLGKWTDNIASGYFADKFREHNTLHRELSGFDFQNGLYYYNVGEGRYRNWDDYVRYGFISAGQGVRRRYAMRGFKPGDVVVAYLKRRGFVGIGKIKTSAAMVRDVKINGRHLLTLPLSCKGMEDDSTDSVRSEYVCLVEWLGRVTRDQAKWRPGLFTTQLVRASLDRQPETVEFVEKEFQIDIRALLRRPELTIDSKRR